MKQRILIITILTFWVSSVFTANGQSRKASQMYDHYKTQSGVKVGSVSKDLVGIVIAFIKDSESVRNILTDVTAIKTITTQKAGTLIDIEDRLPGKKMEFQVKGLNKPLNVWVKRGLWRVKEAHLLYNSGHQAMVISVFGDFKVKELKEVNEKFLQNGGLSKIPMLSNF